MCCALLQHSAFTGQLYIFANDESVNIHQICCCRFLLSGSALPGVMTNALNILFLIVPTTLYSRYYYPHLTDRKDLG